MAIKIDESAIREEVESRKHVVNVNENWITPAGNQRKAPMYEGTIQNLYLMKTREIKSSSLSEVKFKANDQIEKWNEAEIKGRISEAKSSAIEKAENKSIREASNAKETIKKIQNILQDRLAASPVLDWEECYDRSKFPEFSFEVSKPSQPSFPAPPAESKKNILHFILPFLWTKVLEKYHIDYVNWEKTCSSLKTKLENDTNKWKEDRNAAEIQHEEKRNSHQAEQKKLNDHVTYFKQEFEAGNPAAIKGYLEEVFTRSEYPDSFKIEHQVGYEESSQTAIINLTLPCQDNITDIIDYKFVKSSAESKPVLMKTKAHNEFYDKALKETVLRTFYEVFESTPDNFVSGVVINGWVTYLDKASGNDKNSCIISVSADREKIASTNLKRVDANECIKSLKGLIAGPLSEVAPVQPIMQLDSEDSRFVESQEILADINSTTNLAEIGWEEFEHLVRELFAKMFSENGGEVKVTQASSDGGVDAIAFDPDPIRGGKFVIQAKRYTKVVPVSATRDLYGTMIAEGATKGLLVTTAHYGRDSREFVKDKPISLIDGSNLVYLLEKHGHKVRIDVEAARANQERNALAR